MLSRLSGADVLLAEIDFPMLSGRQRNDACTHALHGLLAAWRLNGQILGRSPLLAEVADGYLAALRLPERGALSPRHGNEYVRKALRELRTAGVARPRVRVVGSEPETRDADRCRAPGSFILFTTYAEVESPLRCGDCFAPVPLYRVPPTKDLEYHDVISWETSYQACDRLQMHCAVGERFGTRELSRVDSRLSKQGRDITTRIEAATGVPTYHYLYRYGARSLKRELARPCPGCGGRWLLKERLHHLFAFRCERCRLLSNVAWDVDNGPRVPASAPMSQSTCRSQEP